MSIDWQLPVLLTLTFHKDSRRWILFRFTKLLFRSISKTSVRSQINLL